jgi:hypothetical protein
MLSNKQSVIETPNLGQITLSDLVIKKYSQHGADDLSVEELIRVLQSPEIELVTFPPSFDFIAKENEFWAHKDSSTMFFIEKKDNLRIILSALKTDISYLHFEDD